jgi:hypothetical protein
MEIIPAILPKDYEELKENHADLIVATPMEIAEFIKS